jgi:uncharacterized protein YdhG (YjbR/CyaY superfamily)
MRPMTDAVKAYLAALPADQRSALQALREAARAHLPNTIECISYAMPGFRQPGPKGKMILGYAAFARHLGVYPHSGSVIPKLAADCAGFKTSKSGVLFTPENPLPTDVLRKIIDTRLAELAAGYGRSAD